MQCMHSGGGRFTPTVVRPSQFMAENSVLRNYRKKVYSVIVILNHEIWTSVILQPDKPVPNRFFEKFRKKVIAVTYIIASAAALSCKVLTFLSRLYNSGTNIQLEPIYATM